MMYGSVFRLKDHWRMYYGTFSRTMPALFCMATSDDGIHWERPRLNLVEHRGSKANNILWRPLPDERQDAPTVCHDPEDAQAPFKMIYFTEGGGRERGEYVAFSKDGITWEHRPKPVLTNTGDRTNVMGARDPRSGKFVAFLRHRDMMKRYRARCIWRSESSDFVQWSDPELILRPDLLDDSNTELYGMSGFPYSDIYIGMLERWLDQPDVIEVEMTWSHDGRQWHRPVSRKPFIPAAHPWNAGWSTCASSGPIQAGNTLWFYFGGRSGAHGKDFPRSFGAIGLATLPVDRFAAIQADFLEGRLITRTMAWPGGDLVLNCTNTRYPDAHPSSGGGSIRIEVWDAASRPIPGFSGEQAADHSLISPRGPGKERTVRWPGGKSLRELGPRPVRLVFLLRDARIYSFRGTA